MPDDKINWVYTYDHLNDLPQAFMQEVFETTYEGRPVVVDIIYGRFVRPDFIRMKIFNDSERTAYFGIQTQVADTQNLIFIEPIPSMRGTQQPIEASRAPKLEDFVRQHKPLFESHRDLRETFGHLL